MHNFWLYLESREDFASFVRDLLRDLEERPESWENRDLAAFLDAVAAWTEDMDGYYQNSGEQTPEQPEWRTVARILMAARMYE
ncbi:MAG: DUF7660 family protein [Rubrobacteraceae bacterium]